jgi:hypothetical protein
LPHALSFDNRSGNPQHPTTITNMEAVMAVTVTLVDDARVTHAGATKWIADPVGNLVILPSNGKATHIYAATSWVKAEVDA